MIDMMKLLLQKTLNKSIKSYQSCAEDRHRLHKVEWRGNNDAPSILGEAEIISDTVAGIVLRYIDDQISGNDEATECLNLLKMYSVHRSETLVEFLVNDAEEYESFSAYLQLVEYLRLTVIERLMEFPKT